MSVRKVLEAGHIAEAMAAYYRMRRLRVDPDELHDLAEIAITTLNEIREQQKAVPIGAWLKDRPAAGPVPGVTGVHVSSADTSEQQKANAE